MSCKETSSIKCLETIPEFCMGMKHIPSRLFYLGNLTLLQKPKISIVGTRKPTAYTKSYTHLIAQKLSHAGICIVSGGAMGVDTLAHNGAGSDNTIMVAGTGLDVRYPSINIALIKEIETQGLVISQFEAGQPSLKWNFPLRNELIVALGEVLIVAQADMKSGTMHSVAYARAMGKKIYVLPHRLGESEGTNLLLSKGLAEPLYDIDAFIACYGRTPSSPIVDSFLLYCDTQPLYHEAIERFPDKVFEYECLGKIVVYQGRLKRV